MFQRIENVPTLYIKKNENDSLFIFIYVDDIIFVGLSQYRIDVFKLSMMSEFDITYLGILHFFLRLEVYQGDHDIFCF